MLLLVEFRGQDFQNICVHRLFRLIFLFLKSDLIYTNIQILEVNNLFGNMNYLNKDKFFRNGFVSFEDIACLGDSSSLSEISLDGNPITQEQYYKQIVLRHMQQLKQLDMKRVTAKVNVFPKSFDKCVFENFQLDSSMQSCLNSVVKTYYVGIKACCRDDCCFSNKIV
ncbi:hypothetical protein KUTeg_018401 [Tegillarca granosa]|uniref:Uncharacterized protein n=1 Tax=Tegillarca granosa TaxID=220873 RepID=A0ABQ9EHS3_TEGGR|nr:hypothetical protein KUTeg_018401 [Tegillarca granosa]